MKDEPLDPCRLGCADDGLSNDQLVRADIGRDMIDRANTLNGPGDDSRIQHVPNQHIINAKRLQTGNLVGPVRKCA